MSPLANKDNWLSLTRPTASYFLLFAPCSRRLSSGTCGPWLTNGLGCWLFTAAVGLYISTSSYIRKMARMRTS